MAVKTERDLSASNSFRPRRYINLFTYL